METSKAKRDGQPIEKLRRKYRILAALFIVLLALFAFTAYHSYDYWVFKTLITRGYVYTDALDTLYVEALGEDGFDRAGGYARDFDKVVASMFTKALRNISGDSYTHMYTSEQYRLARLYEKEDAKLSTVTHMSDDTVMISMPNISRGTRNFLQSNKKELSGYKNIIIDLRGNYGGLLADYYDMAELFLPKGSVIGAENTRFSFLTKQIESKKEPYFHFERVVILQDGNTASSAEGFIMSLKENLDGIALVGETTFGKGVGQVVAPMTRGYAARVTVLTLETPGGASIHGIGIPPDICCAGSDAVEHALGLLK